MARRAHGSGPAVPSRASMTLAELVRMSVAAGPEEPRSHGGGAAGGTPPRPHDEEDLRDVPAELSHLLVQLASTPEVEVDVHVAARGTPGLRPGDVAWRLGLRRERGRGGLGGVWAALDRVRRLVRRMLDGRSSSS